MGYLLHLLVTEGSLFTKQMYIFHISLYVLIGTKFQMWALCWIMRETSPKHGLYILGGAKQKGSWTKLIHRKLYSRQLCFRVSYICVVVMLACFRVSYINICGYKYV